MKLLVSLISLGLVASQSQYEPRCGIVCLAGMECASNENTAPLDPRDIGLPTNVDSKKKSGGDGPGARMFGSTAHPGMFPWMAGFYVKTSQKNGRNFDTICGGSILNSRTILTAATCFTQENSRRLKPDVKYYTKAFVGFPTGLPVVDAEHSDISTEAKKNGQGILDIQAIKLHPRFRGRHPETYDAAIIVLKKPIVYHKSINNEQAERADIKFGVNGTMESTSYSWTRPACLAKKQFDETYLDTFVDGKSSASCFAAGYGEDQFGKVGQLRFGYMHFIQRNTCKNLLTTIKGSPFYRKKLAQLPKSYMCAKGAKMDKLMKDQVPIYMKGGNDNVQSACKGDAGSPLACMPDTSGRNPTQFIQAGVTSLGMTCGVDKLPGIYTRMSGITGWVYAEGIKYGKVQFRKKPDTQFDMSKSKSTFDYI